jgi:hypothetical protein
MNNENLSYVAGVFDSEGCVYIVRNKRAKTGKVHYYLRIQITMANKKLLQWIKEVVSIGFVTHTNCKKNREHGYRDLFVYVVERDNAKLFLQLVLPWLKEKYEQALVAIEYQEKVSHAHLKGMTKADILFREYYKEKLSNLKSVPGESNFSCKTSLKSGNVCDDNSEPRCESGVETEREAPEKDDATVRSAWN